MNFNIGKLYEIKKYFWLLYPSKETAAAAVAKAPASAAEYWSKQLNCNVLYVTEHKLITVLEQDKECANVLTSDGLLGWIYVPSQDWVKDSFEEAIS